MLLCVPHQDQSVQMCVDLLALVVYILQPHVPAKDTQITQQKYFQECRCFHTHLEHDNFAEMMTENLKKSLETGELANCQILCTLNFREKKTKWVTESFKGGKNIQDPFLECLQAWY